MHAKTWGTVCAIHALGGRMFVSIETDSRTVVLMPVPADAVAAFAIGIRVRIDVTIDEAG